MLVARVRGDDSGEVIVIAVKAAIQSRGTRLDCRAAALFR